MLCHHLVKSLKIAALQWPLRWVERSLQEWKVCGSICGAVKSKTEKLTPVSSLVSIYHLSAMRLGGVSCLSVVWYFNVLAH